MSPDSQKLLDEITHALPAKRTKMDDYLVQTLKSIPTSPRWEHGPPPAPAPRAASATTSVSLQSRLGYERALSQMAGLEMLAPGWYDGRGSVITTHAISQARQVLGRLALAFLPAPYLYPTPEGGIQAEWTLGAWEAVVRLGEGPDEIVYLDAVNVDTDEEVSVAVNESSLPRFVATLFSPALVSIGNLTSGDTGGLAA